MPVLEPSTLVLLILLGSLALFLSDRLRYDFVALLVVLALVVTRCLTPEEAFAGFASEPVIVIACLGLFGHALSRWGVGEVAGQRLLAAPGLGEAGLILRITIVSALLAAVMSDVAVVAVLIPTISGVARARGTSMSRLLLPVSFGAFLGDLLLVVGSAKNLAVNGVLAQQGERPFGMFEFTHFGLALLAIGALYLAGPGRRLLPRTRAAASLSERYDVPSFVTELKVEPASTLINRSVADVEAMQSHGLSVLGIVRAGEEGALLAPGAYNRIRAGDTLVLQGEPAAILRTREELGLSLTDGASQKLDVGDVQLVEAVVPAGSPFAGKTLAESWFGERTGLKPLALAKQGEVETGLHHTALGVGDSLLVQGHARDLERARVERELIVLDELETARLGRGGSTSVALLVLMLATGISGLLPLHVAALAGAVGLVLLKCVPAREVYPNVDWMVVILIGGMLALGRAFEKHHLAHQAAELVGDAAAVLGGPHAALALLLLVATALAQTTTAIATAVILTPVALSLASSMGVDARAFTMAVLTGTNCAFLSPVSHPANAMVVGPGEYRFRDFLRVGAPLTLAILAFAVWVLPWLWPFHPSS